MPKSYIPSLKTTAAQTSSSPLDALKGALSAADSVAVDRKRRPVITEIMARMARAGYGLRDNETVDLVKLDSCLAAANIPLSDRFQLKSMLRQAQMLPRYS
jgi:hypothetical protein